MFLKVSEIAREINGEIIGNKDFKIEGICEIENGKKKHLSYVQNDSYLKYLNKTKADVIVVNKNLNIKNINKIFILVENASLSFIKLLKISKYNLKPIENSNFIDNAIIGKNTKISSNVEIGNNVTIGDDCEIFFGCFIGDNSTIGNSTRLYPNVIIYDNVTIGNNCQIDSGTVIGADGFGVIKYKKNNFSVPHIGKVIIGDDVCIGSNSCIDRGTINNTIINDNCKLDNQIQIAHNVVLGKGCIIAGQVAIAGSTELGQNVTVAGQSGIIDHLKIGDNCIIAAKSMVANSLEANSFVSGNPAVNHKQRLKQDACLKKLPSILKKIK